MKQLSRQAALELNDIAKTINDREGTLLALEKRTLDNVADWLEEALLQGADLLRARAQVKHGDWMDWLAVRCPAIHYRKANRYMHLASNLTRETNLTAAESLREALALCDVPMEAKDKLKKTKQWAPYMEAIGRLSKFCGFIKANPISKMPSEGVEQLREDMAPIAAELWPDKFDRVHDQAGE